MRLKRAVLCLCIALGIAAAPASYAAVNAAPVDPFNQICGGAGSTSVACKDKELNGKNPLWGVDGVLTKVINTLSIIVGIIAVIAIMVAGFKFVTAGDNPQDVSSARNSVLYSCVALFIAVSAQLMVHFILYKIT